MSTSAPLAARAAEWIVRLSADSAHERDEARRQFDAWKAADPRHAEAAASMESLLGQVDHLRAGPLKPGQVALATALTQQSRRRNFKSLLAGLALAVSLAVPAWMALQVWPPAYLMADVRTGTGQWQQKILPDGTRITLNSASAVNLRYDAHRRTLELIQGEILVDVSKDAARPFVVETRDGSMQAVGTRFVVNRLPDATVLSVLESRVRVQTATERQAGKPGVIVLNAGQSVRIHPDGVEPIQAIDASQMEDGWRQHRLFVHDQPLAEVLDTLARHRSGLIRYDAQAIADIRISAVLPLDDTDRALQLLAANLPGLRVRSYSKYLLQVDMGGFTTGSDARKK